MVSIATSMGQPIHRSLRGLSEYPYTISFAIKKRLQYNSFLELPKEKQPPDNIWDRPEELEEWFEEVFKPTRSKDSPVGGTFLNINDVEG